MKRDFQTLRLQESDIRQAIEEKSLQISEIEYKIARQTSEIKQFQTEVSAEVT